ncbi:hypothetical protein ACFLWR_07325 [Chloroflexota bacterium]
MTLDKWISERKGNDGYYQRKEEVLLEAEETISILVSEQKYWEAFNRLNLMFLYFTSEFMVDDVYPRRYSAFVNSASIDWIAKNKQLIDDIVQGIGGEGYGISTSYYGVSISVSFGSGSISTQQSTKATSSKAGTTRALRPQTRSTSPNNRANVMNRNNQAFKAAANNRSNQMNKNSAAYKSSRSGSKGK